MDDSHHHDSNDTASHSKAKQQHHGGNGGGGVANSQHQRRTIGKDREAALIDRLRRYDQRPEYVQTPGPYPNTYNPEKHRIPFVFRTCERFPPLPEAPPTLDCNYCLVEPRVRTVVLSSEERFAGNKATTADVGQYDVSRGLRLCEERSPCVVLRELRSSSSERRRRHEAGEAERRSPSEERNPSSSSFWHSTLNQCPGGKISTSGVRDVDDFLVRRSASPGPIYKPVYSGVEPKSFAASFSKQPRHLLDSRPTSAASSDSGRRQPPQQQRCARCGSGDDDDDDDDGSYRYHRSTYDSTRALSHLSTWVNAPTVNFGKPVVPFHNPNKVLSPPPPPEVLAILAAASTLRKQMSHQPDRQERSGDDLRAGSGSMDATAPPPGGGSGGGYTLKVTTSNLDCGAELNADGAEVEEDGSNVRQQGECGAGEGQDDETSDLRLDTSGGREDDHDDDNHQAADNNQQHRSSSHAHQDGSDGHDVCEVASTPRYERFGGGHEVPTAAPTRPTSGASSGRGNRNDEGNGHRLRQRHRRPSSSALRASLRETQWSVSAAAAVVMESPFHVVRPVPVRVSTHEGPTAASTSSAGYTTNVGDAETKSRGGGVDRVGAVTNDHREAEPTRRFCRRDFLRPATAAANAGGPAASAVDPELRRKLILSDRILSANDYLHPLVMDRIAEHVRMALGKRPHHHHHQQQQQEARKRFVQGGLTWASASKRGLASPGGTR